VAHPKLHRLACFWDPTDPFAPSNEETLDKFARIAARHGILFERISKHDLASLAEYDALFIRTVTAIDHPSFTFAQTAESLDIPVIDDPQSIIKCSNKVYLHELFRKNGIPTPRTLTVSRKTPLDDMQVLGFPLIVKLPQGTFSQAVKKAHDLAELKTIFQELFRHSPLLIVQEFIPTPFDWRIGILEGRVLYACKYHMAKDHWQIVRQYRSGVTRFGKVEAVPLSDVPILVKQVALEASALIGNGLYGVDVKETETEPLIIEINDNPTIETGDEDAVERDRIYEEIIAAFMRRIQERSRILSSP
jgi:glutathione synthase/RimK-type ligase-like ATP-grasp enzyme